MKYSDLYTRACKKGNLRKDEYSIEEYIDDVNDIGRILWTTIFQGVNGNTPSATRKETITITDDLDYVHTREITKTPIEKIVLDGYKEIKQRTDKPENAIDEEFITFEYDDEEIRFNNSPNGEYIIYYEEGEYPELTRALYDAGEEPIWLKDNFHTIFWSYPVSLNTDTRKDEMLQLYNLHLSQFEQYYSRTETLEEQVMQAEDSFNQL